MMVSATCMPVTCRSAAGQLLERVHELGLACAWHRGSWTSRSTFERAKTAGSVRQRTRFAPRNLTVAGVVSRATPASRTAWHPAPVHMSFDLVRRPHRACHAVHGVGSSALLCAWQACETSQGTSRNTLPNRGSQQSKCASRQIAHACRFGAHRRKHSQHGARLFL